MKFGQQLQNESVPQWRLHNLDYNTLKAFIKVHTTRDQASAIPIPGQNDTALHRFEDDLYGELCRQHDRIGLFVATKADEIGRRLQHVSGQIYSLLLHNTGSSRGTVSRKRQRRLAKYDQAVVQLRSEGHNLTRFVNAQVIAFRKILKKYRKWTGSNTLGTRFRDNVLSDPKSFTRRDFSPLEHQCDDLLVALCAAIPRSASPASTRGDFADNHLICDDHRNGQVSSSSSTLQATSSSVGSLSVTATVPVQTHYWNEYDDGSEAGDVGGSGGGSGRFAVYLRPDDETDLPGVATLVSLFTTPLEKAKKWMAARGVSGSANGGANGGADSEALLPPVLGQGYGATNGLALDDGDDDDDNDDDDAFASDSEQAFPRGYEAHYAALPSIDDQRMAQYRATMLQRGTLGCFVAALVLLGVAGVLVATGRHKMRVEVDAGVITGVVASLGFACAALGMAMAREETVAVPAAQRIAVWLAFAVVCVLNGAMLVLVMGNTVVP